MSDTTRRVTLYMDLAPGWQDYVNLFVYAQPSPNSQLQEGYRRFAFDVDLPVFGGSAEAKRILASDIREVKQ